MSETPLWSRPARLLASLVNATLSPESVPQRFGQPSPIRPKLTSYEFPLPGTRRFDDDTSQVTFLMPWLSRRPFRVRTYTCFVPAFGAFVRGARLAVLWPAALLHR